jgi:hypothetical protein
MVSRSFPRHERGDFVGNKMPENMIAAEKLMSEATIRERNRGTV